MLQIPLNYAEYLWGWPRVFRDRMKDAGTQVILTGEYHGASQGIDNIENLEKLRGDFSGIIWTNKIERIGTQVKN